MNTFSPHNLTLLVVEDEPGDYGLIRALVRLSGMGRGGDEEPVTWVQTLADGIAEAGRNKPDVILLDLSLPDSSGIATVQKMRAAFTDVPLVVLTGHDDSALAIAALEAGAQDYLVKGQFDVDALNRAVRNALVREGLELKLQRMTRLYATLSQCNEAIVHCAGEEELFQQICRALVHSGGMKMAWVGLVNEATRQVQPVASCGDDFNYLDGILISVDGDDPHGHGPAGTAIRENRIFWCRDFQMEPATAPWHERARKCGWGASATLPLLRNGFPIGAITIYSGTIDAFDEEARQLLIKMAANVSYALDNFDVQAKRLETEEQLRRERDFAEGLVNTAQTVVLVLDTQGRIVRINPYLEAVSGYTFAEVQGKDWFSTFLPKPLQEQTKAMFFQAINDIQTHGNVDAIVTRDGRKRLIEWYDKTLKDAAGHTIGLLAIGQDVTERKAAEEALKQLNEHLEQRVAEESVKNREKDHLLIQQSRLAAMGEMMHNIAHQWRQPLNSLTILLANLQDAYEYNELTQESLDSDVKTGQRLIQGMSSTIDDFRNFFVQNAEKQRFEVCDAVGEATKIVGQSFIDNRIELNQVNCNDPCIAFGYPNEFSQVVLNTLTNAKEAIVEKKIPGKVRIQIEKEIDSASISIRDNGGGIPEDILPKIFDPYFTTRKKGTGIGLYMSKMIMERMDGNITIRNNEDGVEVLLTLPVAPDLAV